MDTPPNSAEPLAGASGSSNSGASKRRRRPASARAKAAPTPPEGSVAALIVAHDQARRIAATVRAARAIPGIDLVLVVDDGSTDNTQDLARKAGAVVVRHSHHRGRTASVETGASVIAMRDDPKSTPRAILMLDGSLGNYAIGAAPLVPAVTESVADLAVALTAGGPTAQGVSSAAARKAVERTAHWVPRQPLSRIRCITREALEAAMPLARGDGLEIGMTLDVLLEGFLVSEVECEIRHKPIRGAKRTTPQRVSRLRDVQVAIATRRARAALSSTTGAVVDRLPFVGSSASHADVSGAGALAVEERRDGDRAESVREEPKHKVTFDDVTGSSDPVSNDATAPRAEPRPKTTPVKKSPAKKPAAKKPAAKKPPAPQPTRTKKTSTAKSPAAKTPTAKKATEKKAAPKEPQ